MKVCVKRVYCPKCQRLVTCRDQKVNDETRISCARCGRLIWTRRNAWKYVKESE